jgi:hypothetical protein
MAGVDRRPMRAKISFHSHIFLQRHFFMSSLFHWQASLCAFYAELSKKTAAETGSRFESPRCRGGGAKLSGSFAD